MIYGKPVIFRFALLKPGHDGFRLEKIAMWQRSMGKTLDPSLKHDRSPQLPLEKRAERIFNSAQMPLGC
jgi:hypothetical protein